MLSLERRIFVFMSRIAFNNNKGKWLIGIGEAAVFELQDASKLETANAFIEANRGATLFVAISYDLGKSLLNTQPKKANNPFPLLRIWRANQVYEQQNDQLQLLEGEDTVDARDLAKACFSPSNDDLPSVNWKARESKETYLKHVRFLQDHIQQGNIYEINYCQEFYAENVIDFPTKAIYQALNALAAPPFSFFWENDQWKVVSASPERFFQLKGTHLLSQPIKGTAKRGSTIEEDEAIKHQLQTSSKERSENIMIVDLVRNDCSKIATKNSVSVDELCEIYTFPTVHQMISTVSCEVQHSVPFSDLIKALFPMGSMTGAPKKAAVQLAEDLESFSRGLYSGSVGYISPNGDIDLNVMIRSFIYNKATNYLSCAVGGAITQPALPENEYEECRIKVGKILSILGPCQW